MREIATGKVPDGINAIKVAKVAERENFRECVMREIVPSINEQNWYGRLDITDADGKVYSRYVVALYHTSYTYAGDWSLYIIGGKAMVFISLLPRGYIPHDGCWSDRWMRCQRYIESPCGKTSRTFDGFVYDEYLPVLLDDEYKTELVVLNDTWLFLNQWNENIGVTLGRSGYTDKIRKFLKQETDSGEVRLYRDGNTWQVATSLEELLGVQTVGVRPAKGFHWIADEDLYIAPVQYDNIGWDSVALMWAIDEYDNRIEFVR